MLRELCGPGRDALRAEHPAPLRLPGALLRRSCGGSQAPVGPAGKGRGQAASNGTIESSTTNSTAAGRSYTVANVHNGVIYLASPSNIVQALDGKTGSLIWETRVGPDQAPGYGGIRSIAIADDKIFLPRATRTWWR